MSNLNTLMFQFGTKAETLTRLSTVVTKSTIPRCRYIYVSDWTKSPHMILKTISNHFQGLIAVRSSTTLEDLQDQSGAGRYTSILDINSQNHNLLRLAINDVISSYPEEIGNQVLIQKMVSSVILSGVVMTHNLENGAPYYVYNYDDESGRPDSITGGTIISKTVMLYRGAPIEAIESERIKIIYNGVRELEEICDNQPLDIEFCLTKDMKLFVLQVRPISVRHKWSVITHKNVSDELKKVVILHRRINQKKAGVLGRYTILGTMPDWNPAEIIGTKPRPLSFSLYRSLVTHDTWAKARAFMDYRDMRHHELMIALAGRPYIDVRTSLNSFLPNSTPESIGEKLVNYWLDHLNKHPEYHDKIEFDVATTVIDLSGPKSLCNQYSTILTPTELNIWIESLNKLSHHAVDVSETGSLRQALNILEDMKAGFHVLDSKNLPTSLDSVQTLLDECRDKGALQFAIIARHAFIAEILLRSATKANALTESRYSLFKSSLSTESSQLVKMLYQVTKGEINAEKFYAHYGHLRPGTYDIESIRYADRPELFAATNSPQFKSISNAFVPTRSERKKLESLISNSGYKVSVDELFEYCRTAIVGREFGKFVFTRLLSDALELLAKWGEPLHLNREKISYLTIEQIMSSRYDSDIHTSNHLKNFIKDANSYYSINNTLQLGHIIRSERDLYVIASHRNAVNFVGSKRIEGVIVELNNTTPSNINLTNKIVFIENADPGFDWIFTRGIKGLVTKYGGPNSHMTIRCAEFELPAAIGCGEQSYNRLVKTNIIEIDCDLKILRSTVE